MGIYTKYLAQKKRLEQQIGFDTYSADLKALSDSIAEGGSAFGSAEGFDSARQSADALLGRTKALQEYVKLYGGDSTGLAETSDWLTGQKDYFGRFADFTDYQGQKAEYERLSQNYDFDATAKRIAELREQEAALPSKFKTFWKDFASEASGESYISENDTRKALQQEIAALEKEMRTARLYAAEGLENLPDFKYNSAPKSTNAGNLNYMLDEGAEGYGDVDWRHEYINGFYTGKTLKYDEDSRGLLNEVNVENLGYMTDAEKARYNYFYNTQGRDAAAQYLDGLSETLTARQMQTVTDFGKEHPFLGTLGSLGGSVLGAVEEGVNLFTGNSGEYNAATMGGEAFQSGVVQNIQSDVGAFFYNTGVSALQSVATGVLFGNAGGVVLGLSAMASTRNDMLRRGADVETATKAGLAAGIFECLFESLSLGQLTALKEVPVNGFKDLVLNIAKSIGVNASEEAATEVANILYDTFANGDFSEAQQMLDAGMSKGEIAKKFGLQIGEAAASGAVMGLGFGALGSGVSGATNAVNASRIGKAVKGGETTFGSVSGLTKLGEKYGIKQTAKVKSKGTKASNRAVGDLYRRVHAAVVLENEGTTKTAIEKRLTDLGADKTNAGKLADVVLKKYTGKSLTFAESVSLDNSKVARQALNEMLEDANSKWINDLKATLEGEVSRDITTIGEEERAAAAEQAAGIARSEGEEVQVAASSETLGALPQIASLGVSGMTLAAPSGEVALDDAAMTEDKAMLYTLAGLLPSADIANDFVQAWDGVTDPDAYFRAYQMIYTYGRNHTGYSDEQITEAGKKSGLGEAQIAAAFKSGVKSLAEERRIERERLDGIIQKFRESGANRPEGKYDDSAISELTKDYGKGLDELARKHPGMKDIRGFLFFTKLFSRAFGINVTIIADNSQNRKNGSYNPATNTVTINIYAGTLEGERLVRSAFPCVISHELVHWMKRNAPEQYQALEDAVLMVLKGASTYNFGAALNSEIAKYQEKYGREITDSEAREELVARACEDLFGSSEKIKGFMEKHYENTTDAKSFVDAVKRVLEKIKRFFEKVLNLYESRTAEARIIQSCGVNTIGELQKRFDTAFEKALQGNAARNATGEFEQGGERFSIETVPGTNINYVKIQLTDIVGEGINQTDSLGRKARLYMRKKFNGIVLPLGKTKGAYIRKEGINEYTNPAKEIDDEIYRSKMLAATEFHNLLQSAKYLGWKADDGRHHDVLRWLNYETVFLVSDGNGDPQVLKGIVRIKRIARGDCFYDITKIENITNGNIGQSIVNNAAESESDVSTISIAQNPQKSTPSAQENFESDAQELNSDPEDDVKSDRELLAEVLLAHVKTDKEYAALKKYQERIPEMDKKSEEVARLNREINALRFRKGKREADYYEKLDALVEERNKLDNEVKRFDGLVLKANQPLRELVIREKSRNKEAWAKKVKDEREFVKGVLNERRKKEVAYWKERMWDALSEQRERQIRQAYCKGIETKAKNLLKKLRENTDKHHIPDAFKEPIAQFLSLLDFSSNRLLNDGVATFHDTELQKAFQLVRDMLAQSPNYTDAMQQKNPQTDDKEEDKEANKEVPKTDMDAYLTALDLPPDTVADFIKLENEVSLMVRGSDTFVINRMSLEQLKTLNKTLRAIVHAVNQANELFTVGREYGEYQNVEECAKDLMKHCDSHRKRGVGGQNSKVLDFIEYDNIRAGEVLERLGKPGVAIYAALCEGEDKFFDLSGEIRTTMGMIYTRKEINKWKKESFVFRAEQGEFALTVADIMTLRALSKSEDGRTHILNGGIGIERSKRSDKQVKEYLKKQDSRYKEDYKSFVDKVTLTETLLNKILSKLTDHQREVADRVQKFMAERGAELGNEISLKRWGILLFGKRDYFTISTDEETLTVEQQEIGKNKKGGMFTMIKPSFAHKRWTGAKNRVMIENFFDVAIAHMNDMAKYNAFALPMLDIRKILNYQEHIDVEEEKESKRAEQLRKMSISPVEAVVPKDFDLDMEQLKRNAKSAVEKPLVKKMRELGALKEYQTDQVKVKFRFTGEGLRKSMNSQVSDYGGNLADLAKVVLNMQPLLDHAVLLESHSDKAAGTPKENPQLMQTYVLLSAYQEEGTVTPVQFEIKQYVDNNNRLYLAVALTKIEAGVMGDTVLQDEGRTHLLPASKKEKGVMGDTMLEKQASTRLLPISNISIPDLVAKINPQDENFFKYIPISLLNDEQREAKWRALKKEDVKYGRKSNDYRPFMSVGVRSSIRDSHGKGMLNYIENLMRDFNGDIGGRSSTETVTMSIVANSKIAAVAGNLRVALLQYTAYVRAADVLPVKYLVKGLKANGHLKTCIRTMQEHSPIARWKAMGFRDTNIATPLQTKLKHDETVKEIFAEKTMFLAEWGDKHTWAMIWYACELETRDKHKDLKIGSEEYYQTTSRRFSEVIRKTQVVDSVLTKSQSMRSKNAFASLLTSFMSEGVTSYGLLAGSIFRVVDKKRRGERLTRADIGYIGRVFGVFAVGAVFQALIESVIDAMRSANDDEEYGERYWNELKSNFLQELVPLNLLPVIKDAWGCAIAFATGDYWSSARTDLEVYNRIIRAADAVLKMIDNGEVTYSAIYKILTALSSMTGLPISNLVRDVIAIWNVFVSDIGGGQPIK